MDKNKIEQLGKVLYKEFRSRDPFSVVFDENSPSNIEKAYELQEVYMKLRTEMSGGFAGYKIAYTTKVMQERVGASQPAYGRILSDGVFGSSVTLRASDYVNIGIECEVAVTLGRDLCSTGAPFGRDEIYDAVNDVSLAFELIDGRPAAGLDSIRDATIPQSIATNISGAGVILGEKIVNWQELDIPGANCELLLNDIPVGAGMGSDINGHPVEPVIWLANALASRGACLMSGDIVITGSMVPPTFLTSGTTAIVQMTHLGSVTLTIE